MAGSDALDWSQSPSSPHSDPAPLPGEAEALQCVVTAVLVDLSRGGQRSRNGVVGLGHGRLSSPSAGPRPPMASCLRRQWERPWRGGPQGAEVGAPLLLATMVIGGELGLLVALALWVLQDGVGGQSPPFVLWRRSLQKGPGNDYLKGIPAMSSKAGGGQPRAGQRRVGNWPSHRWALGNTLSLSPWVKDEGLFVWNSSLPQNQSTN